MMTSSSSIPDHIQEGILVVGAAGQVGSRLMERWPLATGLDIKPLHCVNRINADLLSPEAIVIQPTIHMIVHVAENGMTDHQVDYLYNSRLSMAVLRLADMFESPFILNVTNGDWCDSGFIIDGIDLDENYILSKFLADQIFNLS